VLADSESTKRDLLELYRVSPDQVTVIYGGVDQRFQPASKPERALVRRKYHLDDFPYIFSVGTVQPRKNYGRLIEALAQLRSSGHDLHLVIAGGHGWLEDPIYQTVAAAKMQPYVHFIGFAADEDLPALYSAATCCAFPSLYEGFGFPVLESMACKTPVVTSNLSSLPEVAGDAALTVNPYDIEALAYALERLTVDTSLRTTSIERGLEQIKKFTWSAAAQKLHQIYKSVL
jgi:glycosyltransferase involved in cell wall biosynthesis